ncbi:esterase-like activity of phytase-domain-containing protein [Triangularia verruculosa]|uniref:Esterase-like activity of phytase-domain-containing protein n=1 Tax=Triangularia verruculosa TaxID=2587418 RepID=A0AAN7AQN9_9PEZI|nr:esterase-like activity of phytase-domain-containing protein [Triangularia verruculosa]
MVFFHALGALALFIRLVLSKPQPSSPNVFTTTCQGKTYSYNELAGFGSIPSDARDKFGDTISIGSSAAVTNWKKRCTGKNKQTSYTGTLYGLPDRGWNTQGTQNTVPRVHTFEVTFTPAPASQAPPLPPNLLFKYKSTILLTSPSGEPLTGLDPDSVINLPGFPPLPASTYPGDGFGGPGPGGQRITIDAEGLVLNSDGTFWISDEYGPYIYLFSSSGKLLDVIAPPDAILPLRNGTVSFSSDNAPIFDTGKRPSPTNPSQGRSNNQGFEGLTASPDGKELWVMLQSAGRLEGGQNAATRRHTRLLKYDIGKGKGKAQKKVQYSGEWVVPLPTFTDGQGRTRVAAQSEIKYITNKQLLVLPRDSGVGACTDDPTSVYRHVDVIDIGKATDIRGKKYDAFNASIASTDGVLKPEITPATVCPWIDFNINTELNKFGLRNGLPELPTKSLLNEKWESLILLPVDDGKKDEYFLIAISDNDFITQNGFINNGKIPYKDESGCNLDQQALVFRVTLPKGSKPLIG